MEIEVVLMWQYLNISPNYLCYIFIFEFYPGKAYEIIIALLELCNK